MQRYDYPTQDSVQKLLPMTSKDREHFYLSLDLKKVNLYIQQVQIALSRATTIEMNMSPKIAEKDKRTDGYHRKEYPEYEYTFSWKDYTVFTSYHGTGKTMQADPQLNLILSELIARKTDLELVFRDEIYLTIRLLMDKTNVTENKTIPSLNSTGLALDDESKSVSQADSLDCALDKAKDISVYNILASAKKNNEALHDAYEKIEALKLSHEKYVAESKRTLQDKDREISKMHYESDEKLKTKDSQLSEMLFKSEKELQNKEQEIKQLKAKLAESKREINSLTNKLKESENIIKMRHQLQQQISNDELKAILKKYPIKKDILFLSSLQTALKNLKALENNPTITQSEVRGCFKDPKNLFVEPPADRASLTHLERLICDLGNTFANKIKAQEIIEREFKTKNSPS